MDPIKEAMEAYRPSDPYDRLCKEVKAAGRVSLLHVGQKIIRKTDVRNAAVASAVTAGLIRIEVTATGAHPRTDLVWIG